MPFVVWVSGDPGVGKSAMVYNLARVLLKVLFQRDSDGVSAEVSEEDIARYVYSHNTSNKFFDGYNNQPIFVLNDYLQFALENEEQWLIRFTDTVDCPLEVSSVDNIETGVKGEVRFTSPIIIVTSNMSSLVQSANLTNCKAFNRRRDFVLDMTFRPGCSVTENWDYNWCVMRQLTNDGDVRKTFDRNGYMDAVKEIIFTYRRFRNFSEHFELTHAELVS